MELVFDTSVLSCFARAGLLEVLERITSGHVRIAPRAVIEELEDGASEFPLLRSVQEQTWLTTVRVDSLQELHAFARYAVRFGADRNIGEASVLAYAEVHHATAVVDDQTAVQVGRERGVSVKRTLALIGGAVVKSLLTESEAVALVDPLIQGGARFPCSGTDYLEWAKHHGLLST